MIFIITGSRSFQFNRLLKAVDEAVETGKITDEVFAQIGASDYKIQSYRFKDFLDHDEFNRYLEKSDIVLTHGGTGAIVNSVKMGKMVVAVPRLLKYGEVVDDHQVQLIRAFAESGMVTPCYECNSEEIAKAIAEAGKKPVKPYRSNTQVIIDSIDEFINR